MSKTPNPIDRHVGGRVRMRRLMLGYSQTKLADALEVTFQQVQKYEKGVNRIGASRLQDIGRVLGVDTGFFFDGAPASGPESTGLHEDASNPFVIDFLSTAEGLQLNRAFLAIKDPRVRKSVLELVTRIASQNSAP